MNLSGPGGFKKKMPKWPRVIEKVPKWPGVIEKVSKCPKSVPKWVVLKRKKIIGLTWGYQGSQWGADNFLNQNPQDG